MTSFNHNHKFGRELFFIRGASILEILVAAGVSFLIFCIIYINLGYSKGQVSVSNLAHDISVGIHTAQVYGIESDDANFLNGKPKSFGLHFSSKTPHQYVFFSDINGNGMYDENPVERVTCPTNTECVSVWQIENGNYINKFCLNDYCSGEKGLTNMDITFVRPNPEPKVVGYGAGGAQQLSKGYSAKIEVSDLEGVKRDVILDSTGNVSVD